MVTNKAKVPVYVPESLSIYACCFLQAGGAVNPVAFSLAGWFLL